jgi:hypothetical protein
LVPPPVIAVHAEEPPPDPHAEPVTVNDPPVPVCTHWPDVREESVMEDAVMAPVLFTKKRDAPPFTWKSTKLPPNPEGAFIPNSVPEVDHEVTAVELWIKPTMGKVVVADPPVNKVPFTSTP